MYFQRVMLSDCPCLLTKLLPVFFSLMSPGQRAVGRLAVFRSLWGAEVAASSHAERAVLIRNAGYDGVEASLSDLGASEAERVEHVEALREADLELIVGIYSSWGDYDESNWGDLHDCADAQVARFEAQLGEVKALRAGDALRHINAHSGSDAWDLNETQGYFRVALALGESALAPAPVSHETHRGRPLANPFVCHRLCEAFPTLRLTLDASHWFLVCERLLGARGGSSPASELEREAMRTICERVDHIHARVGTPEAPQIGAIAEAGRGSASEWEVASIEAHEALWQDVWRAARARGVTALSATPEYGPAPYTPMALNSEAPLSDVEDVTKCAARRLRALHART